MINSAQIPTLNNTDILVVGAGSAGCMAALSAALNQKYKVMLVERYGFAGGTSTQMLDTFYGFFTPGEQPKKVVGGLPDLVVNTLDQTNDMFLRPNTYGAGTGVNYNPERLKLVWDRLIKQAGVQYLLHSHLVAVEPVNSEAYCCVFWGKSGFYKVNARKVIDASGDADFCHLAGFRSETAGENEPAQSMTTTFRMSNVNLEQFEKAGGKSLLKQKMADAFADDNYRLPRKEGSAHAMCQTNCVATVAVKVTDRNPLDPQDVTEAEIEGREQAFAFERFFQEQVPGYGKSSIIGLSHQIGIRETRRVYGEARLTKQDCMNGEIPADSILLCGAPIEDHRKGTGGAQETYWRYIPNAGVYGVPYGTIVPMNSDNAWVVGRCFSATHDAHASCRSMAQTMAMGQAAGQAAVQSLEKDQSAREVTVAALRSRLHKLGAILEVPSDTADVSKDGWYNNIRSSIN
jgi:hypothetical protein